MINSMNSLPTDDVQSSKNPPQSVSMTGTGGKEMESGGIEIAGDLPIQDRAKEIELPKELTAVGVSQHPTVVQMPHPVSSMGVSPIGANTTMGTGKTITLPLSDDKIQTGLTQGTSSSWRWLAEWCLRKLKQLAKKN